MAIERQFPSHREKARKRPNYHQDRLLATVNYVERGFLDAVDRLCAIAKEDPEAPSMDWTIHELCRHATCTYDTLEKEIIKDREKLEAENKNLKHLVDHAGPGPH